MMWKGKQLTKMSEVFEGALACKDKKEAAQFMKTYIASGVKEDVAKSNLGYFAGYYGNDARARIYELFEAEHPIFGTKIPTAEEAFSAGVTFGRKLKKQEQA